MEHGYPASSFCLTVNCIIKKIPNSLLMNGSGDMQYLTEDRTVCDEIISF